MLDTLPFLRQRGGTTPSGPETFSGFDSSPSGSIVCDFPVGNGEILDPAATGSIVTSTVSTEAADIHDTKSGYLHRMKGGNTSHIGKYHMIIMVYKYYDTLKAMKTDNIC